MQYKAMKWEELLQIVIKGGICAAAALAGYQIARDLANQVGKVHVGSVRIHHYLVGLGAFFTDNAFIRCFLLGAGLEDIPDLLDVIEPNNSETKRLTDNVRKFQNKPTKWGY